MSLSPEQFIQQLAQSGLRSAAEADSFRQSLPPQQ